MIKNIFRITLSAAIALLFFSCEKESSFSEDYDINLPVGAITSISNETPYVGDNVELTGTNLTTVETVSVGTYNLTIVSAEDSKLTVTIPRVIEAGAITLYNKYKREFVSDVVLNPQFYEASVTAWPNEIPKGKPFELQGNNMDLIKEVKVAGKVASIVGSPTENKASYSTADIELNIGDFVTIEVKPKNGETQVSAAIEVVKPTDVYLPKQTIMLFDMETEPATADGWSQGVYTAQTISNGFFGKAYHVNSAAGNGWNGCYIKLTNDNGGAGFDLSAYNKPYITFLVNTNGKSGYMNPALTIGGTESDKHFTGQEGQYSDSYKISTSGWEWRSYDLEAMGFDGIKSTVEKFDLWFRGGNVGDTEEYDIMIDQVMITDGPLNPTLGWDCESPAGSDWSLAATGSAGLTGYNQGSSYATITGTSTGWNDKLGKAEWNVPALDPAVYANGIWINFLLNTGDKEGYFQFDFGSGWMHFTGSQGYGDDYKFVPTQNNWVWRSVQIFPGVGDLASFDSSQDFTMDIQLYGGNISNGTNIEVNVDYFIFTTVPLDPYLNTDEL